MDDSIEDITRFAIPPPIPAFPVIGEAWDDVIGILLAKDLLRVFAGESFDLREMLRPAVFVPESNASTCCCGISASAATTWPSSSWTNTAAWPGLVTIEDVLEQIVGDIEDEYDFDEAADNIRLDQAGRYRVKAGTEIDDFNEAFGTEFSDEYDTVGGLLIRKAGPSAQAARSIELAGLRFQVLRADSRRVYSLLVERLPRPSRSAADGLASGVVACSWRGRVGAGLAFRAVPVAAVALGVLFWLLGPGAPEALRSTAGAGARGRIRHRLRLGLWAMLAGVSWLYVALHRFGGMPMPWRRWHAAVLRVGGRFRRARRGRSSPAAAGAGRCVMRCSSPLLAGGRMGAAGPSPVFRGWPSATARRPPARWRGLRRCSGVRRGRAAGAGVGLAVAALARRWRPALGVALVRLVAGSPGCASSPGPPVGEPVRVALLQTNIEQSLKWRPEMLQHWLDRNPRWCGQPAQLVVLPETTIPLLIDHLPPDYLDALARTAAAAWRRRDPRHLHPRRRRPASSTPR